MSTLRSVEYEQEVKAVFYGILYIFPFSIYN